MRMENKIVFLLLNCLAIVFLSDATVIKNSQFSNSAGDQDARSVGVHGTRTKRYVTGRVPLAYLHANKGHGITRTTKRDRDDNSINNQHERNPPISHFREFRLKSEPDSVVESEGSWEKGLEVPVLNDDDFGQPLPLARRNQRRYPGPLPTYQEAGEEATLSNQDLETLLLLLDGYALDTNTKQEPKPKLQMPISYYSPSYMSPEDLGRASRLYSAGKRGRYDNEYSYLSEPLQMRNKRIGARSLFAMNSVARIKKETDPQVAAQLQEIFENNEEHGSLHDNKKTPNEKVTHHDSSSNPPLLSGGHHIEQVPAASAATAGEPKNSVAKKDIDWSYYFGIDKKDDHSHGMEAAKATNVENTITPASSDTDKGKKMQDHNDKPGNLSTQEQTVAHPPEVTKREKENAKEAKAIQQREENETENKSDRKWILKEFYKNLAMSSSVKRKRDSTAQEDNLSQLEQQMEAAGDKLIWDALKYTGAHKDQQMNENQLSQVKEYIIEKLSAAYSLEKLREELEDFRQKLSTNNDSTSQI